MKFIKGEGPDWVVKYKIVPTGEEDIVTVFGAKDAEEAVKEAIYSVTAICYTSYDIEIVYVEQLEE